MSVADNTNESEFKTNTVSRPKNAATGPPSAKPIANVKAHVIEDNALATKVWVPVVIFGTVELCPGSNIAHMSVSQNRSRYKNHTMDGPRTSSMQRTMPARVQSAKIMIFLRLRRSFKTPAVGAMKNCGRTCSTNAMATDLALPVY